EHRGLHRAPAELVVGAGRIHLGRDHLAAGDLPDHDPAALADRHRVGPGPVAQDRLLDRGGVARVQAGIHALVAGRRRRPRRSGRRLRGLAFAGGDLLQALLCQALLALEALALGADLLQLLLGEPALLLGLALALALGQVDLLLAAALLLRALSPRTFGLGVAAH